MALPIAGRLAGPLLKSVTRNLLRSRSLGDTQVIVIFAPTRLIFTFFGSPGFLWSLELGVTVSVVGAERLLDVSIA